MEKKGEYEFCPKCGALCNNGVCQSCGFQFEQPKEEPFVEREGYHADTDYDWDTGRQKEPEPVYEQQPKMYYDPDDVNTYGGQLPVGYTSDERKKQNRLATIVFGILSILIIILFIYVAKMVSQYTKDGIKINFPDFSQDDIVKEEDRSEVEDSGRLSDGTIDWDDTSWKEDHPNYTADQVGTKYYENVVDCIDTSVGYTMNREHVEYLDKDRNVCIRISYIQLEGDIPNIEKLNEEIKDISLYLGQVYEYRKESYEEFLDENGGSYVVNVDSFVTYNSDQMLSIVLDEEYYVTNYGAYIGMYGININLNTGTVLENTEILKMDEQFAKDFQKRSKKQNGEIEDGVDSLSAKEVMYLLNADDNLILFYTPLGMEVGYNYTTSKSYGWVTVTYQDYVQFGNAL